MVSPQKIGQRIAFARRRAKLSEAVLAERLGISESAMAAIEKGERVTSDLEIIRLAELLSVEVYDLLREHVVIGELSARLLASAKAKGPAAEEAIEQLRQLGAQFAELESLLGIRWPDPPLQAAQSFSETASVASDPAAAGRNAASLVRHELGLGDGAALGIEKKLELEAGLRVFSLPFDPGIAAILIWSDELGACIGLNLGHACERRRLALAFELGRYLRDKEAGDVFLARPPAGADWSESFCDAFASELLMPAEGLVRRVELLRSSRGGVSVVADLVSLARAYEVPFQTMALRLEALGSIERGTYAGIAVRGIEPKAAEKESDYASEFKRLEGYSARYIQLAFEAYDAALITEGELARFLHCDLMTERFFRLRRRLAVDDEGHVLEVDLSRKLDSKPGKAP